ILDTKDKNERHLLQNAPSIHDFLSPKSKYHFDAVCQRLKALAIPYTLQPSLVRGLDYYNETVFEFTSSSLGAQNSTSGGGRYDGLISELGGPDLPSTGFSVGMERLLITMEAQNCPFPKPPTPFIYFVPLGENAYSKCFELTHLLRQNRIPTDLAPAARKVQKGIQQAEKRLASYVIVLGDDELQNDRIQLKHLETRKETAIATCDLLQLARQLYANS
ncbi:MAG TPA: ATP phosphoribosyltransferase regulatory subunit, partial [Chlamydiales bacterium]|nr:ATP phosphoribosyltransferase regulatory subunit [Chlamydiales bacterium]